MAEILIAPGDPIQQRFDGANPGDTIKFMTAIDATTGEVKVPTILATVVVRRANLIITGRVKTFPKVYAFEPMADNVTITGLDCDGNLFRSFGPYKPVGWIIEKNRLRCRRGTSGPANQNDGGAIDWNHSGAPRAMKIRNNVCDPIDSWTCIYMYGGNDIEICWNEFRNRDDTGHSEGRCIKGFGQGGGITNSPFPEGANNTGLTCGGVWVHHNLFSRVRGMAIEMQDGWRGNIYEDNYFETTIPVGTNWLDNRNNWAFSLIEARSINMVVRRNYIDGRLPPGTPSGCMRVGIEVGGCNFECGDNYVLMNGTSVSSDGAGNMSIAANGTNQSGKIGVTTAAVAGGNKLVNAPPPGGSNINNGKVQQGQNNAGVLLSWDINRPKPSAGGGSPQPPQPTVFSVTARPIDDFTIEFTRANVPAGTKAIRYDCRTPADQGEIVGPTYVVPEPHANPYRLWKYHPGWKIQVRCVALDGKGEDIAKTEWVEVTMPGSSTAPFPPPVTKPKVVVKAEPPGSVDIVL